MGRYQYPHSIENGAGERITFARRFPGRTGERLEGDNVVAPGAGAPMHVHCFCEETFTVLEGRIGYQRGGGPEQFGGPGDTPSSSARVSRTASGIPAPTPSVARPPSSRRTMSSTS